MLKKKWYQSVIKLLQRRQSIIKTAELRQPPPTFWKFFKKVPTYSALLSKSMTVSQNGKYSKL